MSAASPSQKSMPQHSIAGASQAANQADAAFQQHQAQVRAALKPLLDAGTRQVLLQNFAEAQKIYLRAIELVPHSSEAHQALAGLYVKLGDVDQAVDHYKLAIQYDPRNAQAYTGLAGILWGSDKIEDARALLAHSLTIDPSSEIALARMLHAEAHMADWQNHANMPGLVDVIRKSANNVEPFALLPMADDPGFQLERARRYASLVHAPIRAEPLPERSRSPEDKIRIGYFSNDFFDHATMLLIGRHFELHDRSRFEIFLYDYGSKSKGELYHRARDAADVFHDVRDKGAGEIAALARSEGIDIAVDLKGYTEQGRTGIFAARAAPLQVSFLGYPGTLGMDEMDYIVADPVVIPEDLREFYSEKVLSLRNCYQVNDDTREMPDAAPSRAELGLPEEGFVFCSFNNSYKVSPEEFDIWMRLLDKVPGSVLWCFASRKSAEENLRKEARKRGIDPDRIIFATRVLQNDHLARQRHADLFLDTFNVNAHTTASDALRLGVPVVTKLGRQFAARVAGSLLVNTGMGDLVTHSSAEYEELALSLATNPERLAEVRQRLMRNLPDCPLFDSEGFTRDFEALMEKAHARSLAGEAPEHISLA